MPAAAGQTLYPLLAKLPNDRPQLAAFCRNFERRPPEPAGHGWGCIVCGLPPDGAYAVLCDTCADRYAEDPAILTTACAGYPVEGRVAIADLPPGPFDHDLRFQLDELPPAGSG
jgi:hypothetical protein